MNVMFDPKAKEYKVYHKTWIDGVDGGMFWKRAVMLHTASADFESFQDNPGHLCLYPGASPSYIIIYTSVHVR
jgi:hypothetical protein